jgi:hypothetical protein
MASVFMAVTSLLDAFPFDDVHGVNWELWQNRLS